MRTLYAFLFTLLIGLTSPAQAEVRIGLHGTIDLGNNVYLTISTPRYYHHGRRYHHGHRYHHKPYRHYSRHHHGYHKKHYGYHKKYRGHYKKHHGRHDWHHSRGHHYGHRVIKPRHHRYRAPSGYIIVRDPHRHDYRRYRHQRSYRY